MSESIQEIKAKLQAADYDKLPELFLAYENDNRKGVIHAIEAAKKRILALEKEIERTENLKAYEKKYDSYSYICGIDEVGRGPLSGPVVAGAVILPKNCNILYINDSKKLS